MSLKKLKKYKGISTGDIVTIASSLSMKHKRAKVKDIFRTGDTIRVLVKLPTGDVADINFEHIEIPSKPCKCEIMSLMRAGCRCGGF